MSRVWGVVSADGRKLHRLTFSKTVAEFCASYGKYEVKRFKIRRGRALKPGEDSASKIYMVCTAECGSPLRATLIKGIAELHHDEEHRLIYEGLLVGP